MVFITFGPFGPFAEIGMAPAPIFPKRRKPYFYREFGHLRPSDIPLANRQARRRGANSVVFIMFWAIWALEKTKWLQHALV